MTAPVLLYPVAQGRCPCCGRQDPVWSAAEIVAAFRRWYELNGRAPAANDWQPSTPGFPSTRRVFDVFGSWTAGREAAGLPKPKHRYPSHRKPAAA